MISTQSFHLYYASGFMQLNVTYFISIYFLSFDVLSIPTILCHGFTVSFLCLREVRVYRMSYGLVHGVSFLCRVCMCIIVQPED